ncbi:uncharacterized protein FTJAE_2985 [Fusarium tjaetaba]|uniref:Uncharacterized protein n=1 Tax=Fusarium tjaetaba TaxID=1567544 RepID=A0A8H5RZ52_9HYPO|nr:uncharacterized protein FTJAE_2985 [Fusarium tjaetaba]KAF5643915.1 hypothetical protein FTJAE_2985 [Fusarium tjaetaba]
MRTVFGNVLFSTVRVTGGQAEVVDRLNEILSLNPTPGEFAADKAIRHLEIVVNGSAVPDVRTFQDRRYELFDQRCMRKIAEAVTRLPLPSINLNFRESEGAETPFDLYELAQSIRRLGRYRPSRLQDIRLVTPQGDRSLDVKILIGALLSRCGNDGVRYLDVDSLNYLTLYGETLRYHTNILGLYVGQQTKGFHVNTWMPEHEIRSLADNGFVFLQQLVFAGLYDPHPSPGFEEDGVYDFEVSINRISTSIKNGLPHLRYFAFCLMEGAMVRCSYQGQQYIDMMENLHHDNVQIVMKSITYDALLQLPQLKQMCLLTRGSSFFRARRTMEVGPVNVETVSYLSLPRGAFPLAIDRRLTVASRYHARKVETATVFPWLTGLDLFDE